MASDVEATVALNPKQLKGDFERKWTALGQGICGSLAIGLGIALFPIKPDEQDQNHRFGRIFDVVANGSFGIWCGLTFLAAAVTGLVRRRQKSMVSTYLALSLASLFFTSAILTAVFFGISATIDNEWNPICPSVKYAPCCRDNDRCPEITTSTPGGKPDISTTDGWDDYGGYNYPRYHQYYRNTTPRPSNYSSPECEEIRATKKRRDECVAEVTEVMTANQAVYGGLVVVSIMEIFFSLYASVAALIAICYGCTWCSCRSFLDCFRRRPREIVYVAYPLSQVANQREAEPFLQNVNPGVAGNSQKATEHDALQPELAPSQVGPTAQQDGEEAVNGFA